jgi:glycerol-3-phosphate dehydrogenase
MRAATWHCGLAARAGRRISNTIPIEYLGDVELPKSIRATSDSTAALAGACTVLLAVPSQTLRANLTGWTNLLGDDVTLVSVAKGIELDTLMRMSQVVVQVTGADPSRVAVVTGPNLASEIAEDGLRPPSSASADSGRAVTPAGAGHPILPAVHQRRCHRRRGRRGMQERDRVGLRHGGRGGTR